MIITRTPLRISFVGGGSDRPQFFTEEPGATVAAAIDKYVYVTVSDKYDGSVRAAYSVTENVGNVDDLRHELIREALYTVEHAGGIEVHSIADIPAGTGLGSSSSFLVGILKALHPHWSTAALAQHACTIEISILDKQIGKQDQFVAAFGGVQGYQFETDGRVIVTPIACNLHALSSHCLLLDTGMVRESDAGDVLRSQQQDRDAVRELARLARVFADRLAAGGLEGCGRVMDMAWRIKRQFLRHEQVNRWYDAAEQAGAWGGKLCGAGGGGFLLFLAPPDRHGQVARATGLRHVPIRVGVEGSKVVYA